MVRPFNFLNSETTSPIANLMRAIEATGLYPKIGHDLTHGKYRKKLAIDIWPNPNKGDEDPFLRILVEYKIGATADNLCNPDSVPLFDQAIDRMYVSCNKHTIPGVLGIDYLYSMRTDNCFFVDNMFHIVNTAEECELIRRYMKAFTMKKFFTNGIQMCKQTGWFSRIESFDDIVTNPVKYAMADEQPSITTIMELTKDRYEHTLFLIAKQYATGLLSL